MPKGKGYDDGKKKKKRKADLLDMKVKGTRQANPRHTVPGQFSRDLLSDVNEKLKRATGKK